MIKDQPPPKISTGDIASLVIEDMKQRRDLGIARYGTTLQPFNGRNSLIDAYQEVLDTAMYLRQLIEEQEQELIVLTDEERKMILDRRRNTNDFNLFEDCR